jgi:uncharacterized membrane protein required for colicin V production
LRSGRSLIGAKFLDDIGNHIRQNIPQDIAKEFPQLIGLLLAVLKIGRFVMPHQRILLAYIVKV